MNEIDRLKELAGILTESVGGTGDIVSKTVIGHHDHESDMMRKQLHQMSNYCMELFDMMEQFPEGDYPHWWQAKIIKAAEYISAAKHYMENELAVQDIVPDQEYVEPEPEMPMDTEFSEPEFRDFEFSQDDLKNLY